MDKIFKKRIILFSDPLFTPGRGLHFPESAGFFVEKKATEMKNVKGAKFVWFTDGAGWKSAARNLEETFDVLDDIYSINDMQNGIMKEVFK